MICDWLPYSEAGNQTEYITKDTHKCTVHSIVYVQATYVCEVFSYGTAEEGI